MWIKTIEWVNPYWRAIKAQLHGSCTLHVSRAIMTRRTSSLPWCKDEQVAGIKSLRQLRINHKKHLHIAHYYIWRASAPYLELHIAFVLSDLISPRSLPQCIVGHEWPSDKKCWQMGHRAPPLARCLGGVPPPSQDTVPGFVSLLRERRSYLVEGDVPIRVMNGLITGSKQPLGDKRQPRVYQEGWVAVLQTPSSLD